MSVFFVVEADGFFYSGPKERDRKPSALREESATELASVTALLPEVLRVKNVSSPEIFPVTLLHLGKDLMLSAFQFSKPYPNIN
jgi:hypothetical protein